MTPERFQHLLSLVVKDKLTKQSTNMRKPISAKERLLITLRFLSSGESQQSLTFSFRVGKATVSKIVSETCIVIYETLFDDYLFDLSRLSHKIRYQKHLIFKNAR